VSVHVAEMSLTQGVFREEMEEVDLKLWDLGSEEEDVHGKQGFHP
jgi:hypothetical protein